MTHARKIIQADSPADISLLQYPIGKFSYEQELTYNEALLRIVEIEAAPAELREAVKGLDESQWDTPYRPGGWTVRQVVHHLPDSHMNGYVRFHMALTEDSPSIKPYSQGDWAELTDARTAPVYLSLDLLQSLHARWTGLMRTLTPEQFQRAYRHPENGLMSLYRSIATYAWHGRHHIAHITSLRQRNGW